MYTVKQASEILLISVRAVSKRCKKEDIRKKNNRYLIQEEHINEWRNEIKKNHFKEPVPYHHSTSTKEIELLKDSIEKKNKELESLRTKNIELKTQQDLELESLRIENAELKTRLKQDIPHQEKLKSAIQLITLEAMDQGLSHKVFTDEEYNDLIGTLSEVDFQTKQVEYLKGRVEKQDVILQELVQQTTQRNFILAKEKGYDKD